jgi:hypothetical protein
MTEEKMREARSADEIREALKDRHPVFAFLLGVGELDGAWFGDKHHIQKGAFWWRKYLRAALSQEGLVAPSRCCGKPVLVWTGNPPEPSHEECCGNFVQEQAADDAARDGSGSEQSERVATPIPVAGADGKGGKP